MIEAEILLAEAAWTCRSCKELAQTALRMYEKSPINDEGRRIADVQATVRVVSLTDCWVGEAAVAMGIEPSVKLQKTQACGYAPGVPVFLQARAV